VPLPTRGTESRSAPAVETRALDGVMFQFQIVGLTFALFDIGRDMRCQVLARKGTPFSACGDGHEDLVRSREGLMDLGPPAQNENGLWWSALAGAYDVAVAMVRASPP
jgi:hypothetical protein